MNQDRIGLLFHFLFPLKRRFKPNIEPHVTHCGVEGCLESGMLAFMGKPIDTAVMVQPLQKLLEALGAWELRLCEFDCVDPSL